MTVDPISRHYYTPTPPPPHYPINTEGYIGITPSICLSFCVCVRFCLDDISWSAQPFLTNLGMVVYYEAESCAEKLVLYLQSQGHSKGLYIQNVTLSTISSKQLVCFQQNLV